MLFIKLPQVSHPWAYFSSRLSHIARYAPSPQEEICAKHATPN